MNHSRSIRAFTLIEMLVVLAIIGVLAGLTVNLAGRASRTKKISRVQAELGQVQTYLEEYKSKTGFYPPDNPDVAPLMASLSGETNIIDAYTYRPEFALNALYYELVGSTHNNAAYSTLDGLSNISEAQLDAGLKLKQLLNSSQPGTDSDVRNFAQGLRVNQIRPITPDNQIQGLTLPVEGPAVAGVANNPWRYNSSKPAHNPNSYDLWAVITIAGQTRIIGNWKD